MKHLGLFEGIGGFSLAARWMGWETLAWCEWNEFGQKVLRHHFPEAEGFGDITKTNFTKYANRIDILTGGFPCQPYSAAGKRLGKEDDRHLWPEMLRVIREVQPSWVVGENVLGLVNWSGGLVFHEVQANLEAEGYEVFPFVLPACAVNAPHRRDRVWFVAHSNRIRHEYSIRKQSQEDSQWREGSGDAIERTSKIIADTNSIGQVKGCEQYEPNQQGHNIGSNTKGIVANPLCNGIGESWEGRQSEQFDTDGIERRIIADTSSRRISGHRGESKGKQIQTTESYQDNSKQFGRMGWEEFPTQPPIRSGDDGLSARLDNITFPKWRNESIKAAGNAIVPQVAFQIFKAIKQMSY